MKLALFLTALFGFTSPIYASVWLCTAMGGASIDVTDEDTLDIEEFGASLNILIRPLKDTDEIVMKGDKMPIYVAISPDDSVKRVLAYFYEEVTPKTEVLSSEVGRVEIRIGLKTKNFVMNSFFDFLLKEDTPIEFVASAGTCSKLEL